MSGEATERGESGAGTCATAPELAAFRLLAARNPVESELLGPSMGATLPSGTRIRIVPLPDGAPRLGQVVAFLAGSRVMVHRVAYLGRGSAARGHVITQGDGNWLCDPPIEAGTIAGVVEEAFIDGAWGPVGATRASAWRRGVSRLSLALLGAALESSPAAAARLARAMSYARMSVRLVWSKLVPARAGRRGS